MFKSCLILNFKTGYHTGYKSDQNDGFPGGLIFDGSFSYGLTKLMLIGVNLEFWNKKNVYKPNIKGLDIYAFGYGLNCILRKSFFKILNIYFGAGVGNYSINRKNDVPGENIKKNYLNLYLIFGSDIKVYKNLFLTADCNLTGLLGEIDFGGNKSNPAFISFKIGPTFLFKIP